MSAVLTPPTIKSWSHSRLGDYEKCHKLAFLKYVKRIPEPDRPLPPGKTEHANDRGTRVHEGIEAYCRGLAAELPVEAKCYTAEIEKLKRMFEGGAVSFEGEWGMDHDWNPTDWKTAWLRLKLDALAHLSPVEAVAIDYKTGRIFGNEIKHGEQLNLYALCSFLRYPELEVVHTELWYLDHNEMTQRTMTRQQALMFRKGFNNRGTALTMNTNWDPKPNRFSCKWCPYLNTEHCDVGIG